MPSIGMKTFQAKKIDSQDGPCFLMFDYYEIHFTTAFSTTKKTVGSAMFNNQVQLGNFLAQYSFWWFNQVDTT